MDATILNAVCMKCLILAILAVIFGYLTKSHIAPILLTFVIVTSLPVGISASRRLVKKIGKAESELEQQNKLLEVVKRTSETFLSSKSSDLNDIIYESMGEIARCVNADRMYIWRNKVIEGKLHYEKNFEWVDEKTRDTHQYPEKGYFYIDTIPEWDNLFSSGNYVNGPVSSLSMTEQKALSEFNIRSILVIPLFLQQEFWGFVSFDDLKQERTFHDYEISILRTSSLLLANSVVQNQNKILIEGQIEQHKLMASISRNFISKEPIDSLISKTLESIGTFLKTSKIIIATSENADAIGIKYSWYCSEKYKPLDVGSSFNEIVKDFFPATVTENGDINAICCNDIHNEFGGKFRFFEKVGAKSFIVAPIYSDGSFWGYMNVEECSYKRNWTESDIQLVGTVTSSIAAAISRALIDKARTEALQQAVQASLAKGNFLANMSHEIRTPMNAIIGMTSIGKNTGDIHKKDYAFEKIENASNHLLGVINDILDMSKIEADKFDLSPVTFNFEKMLEKAVNVISFRINEQHQEFTVTIDEEIPKYVVGDDHRLVQVVTNLLSNAVKFTPERGKIALNAQLVEKNGEFCILQIKVTDSGIGISKEQQARLFTSFEQADSGTSRKFGGTGLGLVISKRIVEMMGGHIWIESNPGKGSAFGFTIKVKSGQGARTGILAPGINIKNIRILAVDDNPEILENIGKIMGRFGISCELASSGEEALQKIKDKKNFDIYFVDWQMPGMDGIELAKKIKTQHSDTKDTGTKTITDGKPVIIMISAFESDNVEKEAQAAGVDKFLGKPLFPSAIINTINECLGCENTDESSENSEKELTENFESFTILLAEDVEINQEIFFTLLEPTGLKIETANNGKETIEKLAADPEKYSMIFMDVQMPEMDGYEATYVIRNMENEWARNIPIVAMTANVFAEDVEKCRAIGMNDHTGKPLDIKEVMKKLRKYLKKK